MVVETSNMWKASFKSLLLHEIPAFCSHSARLQLVVTPAKLFFNFTKNKWLFPWKAYQTSIPAKACVLIFKNCRIPGGDSGWSVTKYKGVTRWPECGFYGLAFHIVAPSILPSHHMKKIIWERAVLKVFKLDSAQSEKQHLNRIPSI